MVISFIAVFECFLAFLFFRWIIISKVVELGVDFVGDQQTIESALTAIYVIVERGKGPKGFPLPNSFLGNSGAIDSVEVRPRSLRDWKLVGVW